VFIGRHGGTRPVDEPLKPDILLTVEPGLYLEGQYGIRTENLYLVVACTGADGGDGWLRFEPLTLAPIDRSLIDLCLLSPFERDWIDQYHARVLKEIGPDLDDDARGWLQRACAPL
jgi:Xaa-Pro aminopeptidase